MCFTKPVIPKVILTRRDVTLVSERGRRYLFMLPICFQVFAAAGCDRGADREAGSSLKFVFLVTNEVVKRDFKNRMDRAFAA